MPLPTDQMLQKQSVDLKTQMARGEKLIRELNPDRDFHANGAPKLDGVVFLVVYAHWCGACKQFMPLFRQFAYQNQGASFICARVAENDQNPKAEELIKKLKVKYFPTLLLFKNGVYHGEYNSNRTIEAMSRFANSIK